MLGARQPVMKADVLLTFCTYQVLYTKKAGGKNCRGNYPGWRIDGDDEMRKATCARTSTSKVPTESRTYNNDNNNLFRIPTSPKCFSVGSCRNYVKYNAIQYNAIQYNTIRYAMRYD